MNATEIIQKTEQHGGEIRLENGRLKITAPAPLPDEIQDAIKHHKHGLIRALTPPPMPPMPRSVRACLDFIGRHPKKELTPGLTAWLDREQNKIDAFERAQIRSYNWSVEQKKRVLH